MFTINQKYCFTNKLTINRPYVIFQVTFTSNSIDIRYHEGRFYTTKRTKFNPFIETGDFDDKFFLHLHYTISNAEICVQYFPVILKRSLQNYWKILEGMFPWNTNLSTLKWRGQYNSDELFWYDRIKYSLSSSMSGYVVALFQLFGRINLSPTFTPSNATTNV